MTSPFLQCLQLCQTFGVFALFPGRWQVCRFSRIPARWSGKLAPMPSARVLVHLCPAEKWSSVGSGGEIRPDGGGSFVHLSTPRQVHLPANRLYRGRSDLLLLYIDPVALDAPVRWEPGVTTDPESMLFPHLYGPLPTSAVIKVTAYSPAPDGSFPPLADT
jgi:uncharacterized protein (DUF952 family)